MEDIKDEKCRIACHVMWQDYATDVVELKTTGLVMRLACIFHIGILFITIITVVMIVIIMTITTIVIGIYVHLLRLMHGWHVHCISGLL